MTLGGLNTAASLDSFWVYFVGFVAELYCLEIPLDCVCCVQVRVEGSANN